MEKDLECMMPLWAVETWQDLTYTELPWGKVRNGSRKPQVLVDLSPENPENK